jgi:hypothetical protein
VKKLYIPQPQSTDYRPTWRDTVDFLFLFACAVAISGVVVMVIDLHLTRVAQGG